MYDRFIARQPILDTRLQVWGYELLFRESDSKDAFKGSAATSHVIANSTMTFNWSDLVGNTRAFLNFTAAEPAAPMSSATSITPCCRMNVQIGRLFPPLPGG